MTAWYSAGKNEVLQLKKEVGKQRREKKVAPAGEVSVGVGVSSPVGSSELQELQELCRNLKDENEVNMLITYGNVALYDGASKSKCW